MAKHITHALEAFLFILSCSNVSHAQVPHVQHVLIVLEENSDYADACGPKSTSMPFLCGLKSKGSFSANYYAPTHPSIGNYEDLGWGVVTTNDDNCIPNACGFPYTGNNIVRAAAAAGKTSKGYAESLPANCYFGGDSGNYAVHHSPIPYISDVRNNCQNRYVAFEDSNLGFLHDVASNTLPNFSFITPNMCDDAHDCGLDVADNWLKTNVWQPLLNSGHLDSATGDTVVIVVFDESGGDNTHGGGKVYWFMIGKNVKQNYQSTGPLAAPGYYSHESSLRVTAEMLGVSLSGLGGAGSAPDMAEFFGTTTNSPPPEAVLRLTPQTGAAPLQITADSSASSDSNGGITSRLIDFGDGTISTAVSASHTYSAAGTFSVALTVADSLDLTSTSSNTVIVQSASQPISVSVSPASATVGSGSTEQFAATVANTANQAVTWTSTAGVISGSGWLTAPVVSTKTTIMVTARSVAASSSAASATITVQASRHRRISVAVSPVATTVSPGSTQQFTATVANTANQDVSWTATAGAISTAGLFTAPVVSTNTTVSVTARSVAVPSQSANATVQIVPSTLPPPAPLTPSGPITITGQSGTVVENLHITNPSGDCVVISNSTNVIIRKSDIGPCGGNGVKISGGSTVGIYDMYIHPEKPLSTQCCDTHDGIFANKTSNLSIQGNVIAYGESNIEVTNSTTVSVTGNFLLNPIDSDPSRAPDGQSRGQNVQAWGGNSGIIVENNYTLSSTDKSKYLFAENQEDSINFGLTEGVIVQGNYITGGHSPSGCGVIADDRANNAQFLNNKLLDTGQCGISIANGTNQVVSNNKILNRTPVQGGGNTAIMVWSQYSAACGPVTVSGNIATESKPDGSQSGFWNGGGCGTVSSTNNTFDGAALTLLTPPSTTMPPPAIPPAPKDCAVVSPFTDNTNLPSCSTK